VGYWRLAGRLHPPVEKQRRPGFSCRCSNRRQKSACLEARFNENNVSFARRDQRNTLLIPFRDRRIGKLFPSVIERANPRAALTLSIRRTRLLIDFAISSRRGQSFEILNKIDWHDRGKSLSRLELPRIVVSPIAIFKIRGLPCISRYLDRSRSLIFYSKFKCKFVKELSY